MDEHSAASEYLDQNLNRNGSDISNVTTTPAIIRNLGPFDRYIDQMPLMGYPGPIFNLIHILALVSLAASTLVSVLLIIGLCFPRTPKQRVNDTESTRSATRATASSKAGTIKIKSTNRTSFWKWHISERLVIYLAVADTFYGISHSLDHGYMLYAKASPPDRICSIFAFVLQEFVIAQWIIILYTAVNACSLIVFTKKLDLGWMDWKLILVAFGSPLVLGAVTLSMGLLGQSGAW